MLKKLISIIVAAVFIFTAFPVKASAGASKFLDIYLEEEGKQIVKYKTTTATVGDFLAEINLKLNEKDEVTPALTEKLKNEMKIAVKRGFSILLQIDNVYMSVWAKENYAIGNVISDLKEKTGLNYSFDAPMNTPVFTGQIYRLTTERIVSVPEYYLIPYEIFVQDAPELPAGTEIVISYGEPGLRQVIYNVRYSGEKETGRDVLTVTTVKEPTAHVICRGSATEKKNTSMGIAEIIEALPAEPAPEVKETPAAENKIELSEPQTIEIDGHKFEYIAEFMMNASAYTAASSGKSINSASYGITASGIKAEPGVVAVDKTLIPLGSRLYVVGYGFALAADTGPSIKGLKIDLYYDTFKEAINFGRRDVKVYLISTP